MKYTILVNQLAVYENGLSDKTDLNDWAIVDYIKDWQTNPKAQKMGDRVWINYKHMAKMMPCLCIKSKSAISARINKLRDLGVISTQQDLTGRLFVSITEYGHSIITYQEVPRGVKGVRS